MSDRHVVQATVCAAVLLSAGFAQASQVDLVSKRHPSFDTSEVVGEASEAVLSADGRWTAFTSTSPNLAPGQSDGNRYPDVFLLDRLSGEVTLVSHAAGFPDTASALYSSSPSISDDGRWIAFQSGSGNLVPGQTGGAYSYQVYLHDRIAGSTVLVSHAAGSTTASGNATSSWPRISGDGSHVAFMSLATNLVPGASDANTKEDVFLYDRAAGTTILVSRSGASAGTAANGRSLFPEISADGGYVLYGSEATDVIAGGTDSNLGQDVFLYSQAAGTNKLVSHAAGLPFTAAGSSSIAASLSDDGAFAVFTSQALNLVAGQTGAAGNTFLFERATGAVTLVSHTPGSSTTAATAYWGSISGDGAWVAFGSTGTGLIAGGTDTNGDSDIFLFERATGAVTLVSRQSGTAGTAANAGSNSPPTLSQDGRYVLFASAASNLVPFQVDPNGFGDVFLFDRVAGTMALASHMEGSSATAGNQGGSAAALSADGSFAAFLSGSTDLTAEEDLNGGPDLFLYSHATGTNAAVSFSEPVVRTSASGASFGIPNGDGRFHPLASAGTDLVEGQVDANDDYDVFLADRLLGTTTLVSHAAGSPETAANKPSNNPRISADGKWMVFYSEATDLIPDIGPPPVGFATFIALYGREAGTLTLVSRSASDPTKRSNGSAYSQEISGNGRYVVFSSTGTNLVTGQLDSFTPSSDDVFLYDRVTGSMALASHSASNPLQAVNGSGSNQLLGISFDGRFVIFPSRAGNLVSGQTDANNGNDLFLYDRDTGAVTLVTRAAGSATTTASAPTSLNFWLPALSADGRYFAYVSAATNLVAGQADTNGGDDVFLFDRVAGTTTLLSRKSGTLATTGNAGCSSPAISDDGRHVAFSCWATNLVPGQVDLNQGLDAFLYDRTTDTVSLLSPDGVSTNPNAYVFASDISPDGRFIAIQSTETLRVPGQADQNGAMEDLFVLDRLAGTARLASHSRVSRLTTANASSGAGFLAGGGSLLFFRSGASDFVEGDYNEEVDVYVSSAGSTPATDFFTLTPCRVADTRTTGALTSGTPALFELHGVCGIPGTARAVALNVTVAQGSGPGSLTLYPGDADIPFASAASFNTGVTRANNAILPLAYDGSGTLAVLPSVTGGGTVHVILDVVGWFE
ncbi:MAG: hypothetical protein QOH06_4754 [Acidobacteriota bacterium]|jgi:Tol biopolymer transport system component|nr:hypothetical protein [Acidobacteriota bacterium]